MKIITRGRKLEDRTHAASCYKCGCVFQYKTSEARSIGSNQRDGSWHDVICPQCGSTVINYNVTAVL